MGVGTSDDFGKSLTDADYAEELLRNMLGARNPYSETFRIKSDGKFDKLRIDGVPVYLVFVENPDELYRIAAEIREKHPEYHFVFETDPEGQWMKYTATLLKQGGDY